MNTFARHALSLLFTAACVVAVQIAVVANPAYPLLWVLPLVFVVMGTTVLLTSKHSDAYRWVEYALSALWFVRLVLIPWLMVQSGFSYQAIDPMPSPEDYRFSVLFMAYETVIIGIALIGFRAFLRRGDRGDIQSGPSFRRGSYVLQGVLIGLGATAMLLPAVTARFSFFTTNIVGTAREILSGYDSSYNALANLANLARLAVPGTIITLALKAQQRRPSLAYPVFAMAGCVAVNLFYVVTSRASFFVPLVAAIIVLALVFPLGRPFILVCAGSALIATTIVVTQNKSLISSAESSMGDIANYLSTYLMGPKEYAVGVSAVRLYGGSVSGQTLAADTIGNVPILSSLVDPLNRTSQFYNWTYLGRNLGLGGGYIAPASVQGAFYVGWLAAPLVPMLGLLPALVGVRYLRRAHQDPSLSYVAAFAVVAGLIYHTNSFSTVAAFVAFPILPLALLAGLDRWLATSFREDVRRHDRHSYHPA